MTMLSFLLGLWIGGLIGGLIGVVVMCLLQINHGADTEYDDG